MDYSIAALHELLTYYAQKKKKKKKKKTIVFIKHTFLVRKGDVSPETFPLHI